MEKHREVAHQPHPALFRRTASVLAQGVDSNRDQGDSLGCCLWCKVFMD